MKNKMKFKIGEFSKLCQVTVKTLRHYEEIGLMIPVEVDEWTGYRYYDISQLRCMSRIVYLKQLGFSLEEISELFADGKEFPDAELLKVKIERCKNEIEHLIWRQTELAKLENLLHSKTITRSCVSKTEVTPAITLAASPLFSGRSTTFNRLNFHGSAITRRTAATASSLPCFAPSAKTYNSLSAASSFRSKYSRQARVCSGRL